MRSRLPAAIAMALALTLSGCASAEETGSVTTTLSSTFSPDSSDAPNSSSAPGTTSADDWATTDFSVAAHGRFNEGWAMEFLPGTDHLLVTERGGALQLRDQVSGEVREIDGVPEVYHQGQAGMHDVIAGPTFEEDGTVYLSWVKPGDGLSRGAVATAVLNTETAELEQFEEIWEQDPVEGVAHFALRMHIQDDHLFLTSGERHEQDPAQDPASTLGKVLRLTLDGRPAPGNPFAGQGGRADEVWTIGHRNPLGIDEDSTGRIWVSEMGPEGGDELNVLVEGENYGWPEASMGNHYDGEEIADHREGDGFRAPAAYWVPSISPGSLEIYQGELFPGWRDSALLGGLSGQTLVRVALDGEDAEVVGQWDMGERIREVAEAPDGSVWLLEDGSRGRLLELRPA